jgi:hypothetical protein
MGNFVRFSATFEAKNEQDEVEILREVKERFESLKFEF